MSKEDKKELHLRWYGIPQLLPFLKPYGKLLLLIIITFGLGSVVDTITPLFQNYAIDHFIGEEKLDTLPVFVILWLLVLLFQCFVNYIGCYTASRVEVYIDRDVRQACFDHVQTLSFSYFNQNSVGYIHSRIISDPNRIGIIVSWGLMDAVCDIVYMIGIFLVMFLLQPFLGLLLLCVVPLEIAITWFFQQKMTEENRKVREILAFITGNFNEGITGAMTVKTLVAEKKMQQNFEKDSSSFMRAAVNAGRYRSLFRGSIVFFSSIALALVLWRGGILNREGLLLLGSLSVFMNYAVSVSGYVEDLVSSISNLVSTQVNIERITKLLNTEPDVKDSPEVTAKYGDAFHPKKENWEPLYGKVEFKDVTFRYPDGEENVLEHFNLLVPQGSMTAIVGETGAGKSTLVNLVCRFFEPQQGQVLIDDRDVRERSQGWLHSNLGYVLQTPHLFSGTVRENLCYGNPVASEEEIEYAVKRVRADQVIARMENGLDSQVGEGGSLLSVGEKQLISFARALLADPRILILDEATSSVDSMTEKAVQDAMQELTKGRTSFVIAHRLSTIRRADRILAMQDGKVVEAGTHTELMAKKGYYYQLYTLQFAVQEAEEGVRG